MDQLVATPQTAVHIQGDVHGQVAVGQYVVQIGSVKGGLVYINQQGQPAVRPRPAPVRRLPRPFTGLLDRQTAIGAATAALGSSRVFELYGQTGIGKTALLRHLAHAAPEEGDSILYLPVMDQPWMDLLQQLFDAFYETEMPFKPSDGQILHYLQAVSGIVLLDDVKLDRYSIDLLANVLPNSAILLASEERHLWDDEGSAHRLGGLPMGEAVRLLERALGQRLPARERAVGKVLCTLLDGHPLNILRASALVRDQGMPLTGVTRQLQVASPADRLTELELASSTKPERRLLAVLAAFGGAPIHVDALVTSQGNRDVSGMLEDLSRRGLIMIDGAHYQLSGSLVQALEGRWDAGPVLDWFADYFQNRAELYWRIPEDILANLESIMHVLSWSIREGRWSKALELARIVEGPLALANKWGAWEAALESGLQAARRLEAKEAEAWALHQLGTRALCLEEKESAQTSLIQALRFRETLGDHQGAAITRHNLDVLLSPPPTPNQQSSPQPQPPAPTIGAALPSLKAILVVLVISLGIILSGIVGWYAWENWPARPVVAAVPPTSIPTASITPMTEAEWDLIEQPVSKPTKQFPSHTPTKLPTRSPTATSTPTSTTTSTPTLVPTATPIPCNKIMPAGWIDYVIQAGDTLSHLARSRGTSVQTIQKANCLFSHRIYYGRYLYVPPFLVTETPTATWTPTVTWMPTATITPTPEDPKVEDEPDEPDEVDEPDKPDEPDEPDVPLSPPDLVASFTPAEPQLGEEGQVILPFRVTVSNLGETKADNHEVSVLHYFPGYEDGPLGPTVVWSGSTGAPLPGEGNVSLDSAVTFGSYLQGATVILSAVADSCQSYDAICRVEESNEANNASAEVTISLPVADPPTSTPPDSTPVAKIYEPADGREVYTDNRDGRLWYANVFLQGAAEDEEDGGLTGEALVWRTNQTELQDSVLGYGNEIQARLVTNSCSGTTHEITLTATDSILNEVTATVTVIVYPYCVEGGES